MIRLADHSKAMRQRKARDMSPRVRSFLSDFSKDESGVLVAFSVWFMLMILLVGALGIDVMRFETERTRLQASLDQAVLAAADLDQQRDPTDYLEKFGVDAELTSVEVDEGLSHRHVQATARQTVPTQIVHMLGVTEFTVPAASSAEERVEHVEISLVLDVSGSMNGTRIKRLRTAAVEFIDTIFAQNETGGVTVSIVPYSTQVNIGKNLMDEFDVDGEHEYSHCLNIDTNDYNNTTFGLKGSGVRYEQTQHFDVFTYSEGDPLTAGGDITGNHGLPICRNDPESAITPISGNKQQLISAINALSAGGNTSIDLGVKWGASLLDPSFRPAIQGLVADGEVSASYANRPLNHTGDEAIKVMVVMTDGQNTAQYRLPDEYRSGKSNVYYNKSQDIYGVYWPNTRRFYRQTRSGNTYVSRYNGDYIRPPGSRPSDEAIEVHLKQRHPGFERLTMPELFARASNAWIANYLYRNLDRNYWSNWYWRPMETVHAGKSKNEHTHTICNAAKQENIVIYTIGFEAPRQAQNLLEQCASTKSHYFDVQGTEISEAFSAIAASISQLKLVQ